jgi:HEAT repeat protein/beta-lactamase regulating signal transducer with metallopeptidase domain
MRADFIPLLGSWLLTYLLHSTLLLGAVWLLGRRLVQSAALRDLLWKAALVGGFATATLQIGLGYEPLGGGMRLDGSATRRLGSSGETSAAAWGGLLGEPSAVSRPPSAESPSRRAAEPPSRPLASLAAGLAAESPSPRAVDWLSLVVGAWATTALAFCGLYLIQRRRAMKRIGPRRQVSDVALLDILDSLRRAGNVRRVIRLTATPGLSSPVALGRDEIALPEAALTDLDRDQQRSLLAHELAHLERRDPAWLALACLTERAFFLQPLNLLARVKLQEAAELLCDDWAVHRTGSGVSLAACLVKVAEWVDTSPRAIPLAGMAERRSQLVTRIHRLIEGRIMPAAPRSLWFVTGATLLVALTALAAPSITATPAALLAQDTASAAPAPEPDHTDSWYRRMMREARLARSRARIDSRRAEIEARAALAGPPMPPEPPRPALAPRLTAEVEGAFRSARAELARMNLKWHDQQGEDTTNIAVPALIAALKDENVEVRRAAARSLSNHRDRRAVPGLIEALKDSDPEVRMCAADALGEFADARAVPGLAALLKDGSKDVRRAALSALDEFADQVPVETILTALNDSDADVRMAALSLASNRLSSGDQEGDRPADPRLVTAFTRLLADPNADVRTNAASALGESRLREAPSALLLAAKDKNADVRVNVVSALGEIRDPRSVTTLKELLQDPNGDVREHAVQALSEIRDRSALEALVTALKSPDPVVRRSAAEALGQRDLGE